MRASSRGRTAAPGPASESSVSQGTQVVAAVAQRAQEDLDVAVAERLRDVEVDVGQRARSDAGGRQSIRSPSWTKSSSPGDPSVAVTRSAIWSRSAPLTRTFEPRAQRRLERRELAQRLVAAVAATAPSARAG